jgi:hypothetical protein
MWLKTFAAASVRSDMAEASSVWGRQSIGLIQEQDAFLWIVTQIYEEAGGNANSL